MKNVIFDLGRVVLIWNPEKVIADFTQDQALRERIKTDVFFHQDWLDMDKGLYDEATAAPAMCKRTGLTDHELKELLSRARESLVDDPATITLMHECARHGLNLYCLSNLSIDNYHYIKNRAFFKLFKGAVISALEKMIKPDENIFNLIVNRYDLDPSQTLFIDDTKANVETAERLGIKSIQFTPTEECFRKIREIVGMQ